MLGFFLLAVGGLFAVSPFFDQEMMNEPDEDLQPPDSEGEDILDTLDPVYVDGSEGHVQGGSGGETFIVNTDQQNGSGFIEVGNNGNLIYYSNYDDAGEMVEIDAGSGDDSIVVESGSAIISTGEGVDIVDASGMNDGIIIADSGDIVIGSDVTGSNLGVVADGATFEGGIASETASAIGNGASLSGGGGDDWLFAFEGNSTLDGGAGDDHLIGNATAIRFCECTATSNVDLKFANQSADVLDGGAGNDVLELSYADIGTGGEGADLFKVFYGNSDLQAATVTDFLPSEDQLLVQVGGGTNADWDDTYDLTNRVNIVEEEGNTFVSVDGDVVVNILGKTDLSVGYPDPDSLSGYGSNALFVDSISGELSPRDNFDVIIQVFPTSQS